MWSLFINESTFGVVYNAVQIMCLAKGAVEKDARDCLSRSMVGWVVGPSDTE